MAKKSVFTSVAFTGASNAKATNTPAKQCSIRFNLGTLEQKGSAAPETGILLPLQTLLPIVHHCGAA
jgi:hypothetical protein